MKVYTLQEYENDEMLLLRDPVQDELLIQDVEDYLESLDNDGLLWKDCKVVEEVKQQRIEQSKTVDVVKCKKASVDRDWLWCQIVDYMDLHYGNELFDVEPNGEDLFDNFVQEFNDRQTCYIGLEVVGTIDLSKDVIEYFKEGEQC